MALPKKPFFYDLYYFIVVSFANSQLREGAWGIKANLFGASNLGMADCLQPDLDMEFDLGFSSSKTAADSSSRFFVGITPWYYLGTSENVSAFAGGLIGLSSESIGGSRSGFSVEGHFGAEYWFSPKFSWNGYIGLGLTSYSGGNGSQFGTFSSTGLTWFFLSSSRMLNMSTIDIRFSVAYLSRDF